MPVQFPEPSEYGIDRFGHVVERHNGTALKPRGHTRRNPEQLGIKGRVETSCRVMRNLPG
jgi:hypothetical protein